MSASVKQRHATPDDQRLIDSAQGNLAALIRGGEAVMLARRSDPDDYRAAQEALGDDCFRLVVHFARNPCELFQFLRAVAVEAGTRRYPDTTTTTEVSTS